MLNLTVVLPSHTKLGGILLDRCYYNLKEKVNEHLNSINHRVCLTMNFWTNITSDPVVVYMGINNKYAYFIDLVYTKAQLHTGEWILEDISCILDGANCNIVGVVTNNTSANRKAWGILQGIYPKLFFHGCVCHALHLVVKDIEASFTFNK